METNEASTMTLPDAVLMGYVPSVTAERHLVADDYVVVTMWPNGTNMGGQPLVITAAAARYLAASLLRATEAR